MEPATVVAETGACAGAAAARPRPGAGALNSSIEELARLSLEDFNALVARRLAARERETAWRTATLRAQVSERAAQVQAWPAGTRCPLGRLREAWAVHRYGLAEVVNAGAAAAGAPRPELTRRLGAAIELYEAHAQQRPPGWPESGAAALCVLAAQRRADRLAGDVARLMGLARGMRAAAAEHDPERLVRARARAERRHAPPPSGRFVFRVARTLRRRLESAEQRRQRVRDALLLAGADPAAWPNAELAVRHHPAARSPGGVEPDLVDRDACEELDGVGARARRYRDELARGRWQLPHPDSDPHPGPKEAPTP